MTVVEVDSNAHHACFSLMSEATCLIERPIPCTLMPEVVEMVVYPTSLDHLLDKSLSSSGPSPDCHVTRNVSHSSCNSNCIVIYI